jgi:hypothetical protein
MAWLSLAGLLLPAAASAKPCGDNVRGMDVPCACGDTLVSDLVLGNDPILKAPCADDGLVVRAPDALRGLVIDLRGLTLRGRGKGTGLWVVSGGRGGARIVSSVGPATIEGFRDGILGDAEDGIALVEHVAIVGSMRDGIRVRGAGYEIRDTEVRHAGRDAYGVIGRGFRLAATRAVGAGRFGYFVLGQGGIIGETGAGSSSDGSGAAGFSLMGMGHRLVDCVARGAGKDGVHLQGMHYEVRGCMASGNRGDGIGGMGGMDWTFAGNRADDNDGNGILAVGGGLVDAGGNSGSGNRGLDQQRPVAQCEIGGVPCR